MSSQQIDLIARLSLIGAAVDAHVLRALSADGLAGLRPSHGYLVQRLLVAPATATEIARALGITQQAVSKAARELAGAGYLRQTSDVSDARRRPFELTERGHQAVATARAARSDLMASLEGDTAPSDRIATDNVLNALMRVLGIDEGMQQRAIAPPPETS